MSGPRASSYIVTSPQKKHKGRVASCLSRVSHSCSLFFSEQANCMVNTYTRTKHLLRIAYYTYLPVLNAGYWSSKSGRYNSSDLFTFLTRS